MSSVPKRLQLHLQHLATESVNACGDLESGREGDVLPLARQKVGGFDGFLRGYLEEIEGMGGDVDAHFGRCFVEVHHHEDKLLLQLAEEGVLAMGVEARIVVVGIHEVVESAFGQCIL